jgi:hypothetical protein
MVLSKSTPSLLLALASSFTSCYVFSLCLSVSSFKSTNSFGRHHIATSTALGTARQQRIDRKSFIVQTVGFLGTFAPICSASTPVTGVDDGNLPGLPSDAVRSYLQYRLVI